MEKTQVPYRNAFWLVPLSALLLIWFVFALELKLGTNWNEWGVYPRSLRGLRGVLFSPLIHGSLSHLSNNSMALGVMLSAVFYFYSQKAWQVLFWSFLGSGLLTWLIGRESYHIGASGIIYALVAFVFFKGIWSRYYRWIALSLGTVFLYGSLIWYIFPIKDGVSWEGHLSGFVTGLVLALSLHIPVAEKPRYAWEREDYDEEDDPFMRQFDEKGNFRPMRPEEEGDEGDPLRDSSGKQSSTTPSGQWVSNSTIGGVYRRPLQEGSPPDSEEPEKDKGA